MDLAFLVEHADQLRTFLVHQRIRETPVAGGSTCFARRLTLDTGESVFVKSLSDPAQELPGGAGEQVRESRPGLFEAEAAGLAWLGEAEGAPVPDVLAARPNLLMLRWLTPAAPSKAAAERFGRELATTHRAGASAFGALWAGYLGSLAQDNRGVDGQVGHGQVGHDQVSADWAAWFALRRLSPYLRMARDNGALDAAETARVDRVVAGIERHAPPAEPPARLHGDLWPGNLLWGSDGRVWLIDPSAHGGHRETDLAQLALFGGAPHLERIVRAYDEAWPLAQGWPDRVPLHQLHLMLAHAARFGSAYRSGVLELVDRLA